jgi:hypothetical protein
VDELKRSVPEPTGECSIRVRLCCGVSHQPAFASGTFSASGRRLSILNGPVPLAWLVV